MRTNINDSIDLEELLTELVDTNYVDTNYAESKLDLEKSLKNVRDWCVSSSVKPRYETSEEKKQPLEKKRSLWRKIDEKFKDEKFTEKVLLFFYGMTVLSMVCGFILVVWKAETQRNEADQQETEYEAVQQESESWTTIRM